jgi:hypothetical protein
MLTGLITFMIAAGFGQANPDMLDLSDKKDRQTYILILDTGEKLPAFCKKEGEDYIAEVDYPPWQTRMRLPLSRIKEFIGERPAERYQRIKKWCEQNGYLEIGDWKFYAAKEVQWAKQARKMAGVDKEVSAEAVPVAAKVAEPVAAEVAKPGIFVQWGAHAALVLVAVLLIGLIFRTLILPGNG